MCSSSVIRAIRAFTITGVLFVGATASAFDSDGMNAVCQTELQQINFSLSPPTMP